MTGEVRWRERALGITERVEEVQRLREGIAALLAEATGYRGRELWSEMVQESQRLLEPSVDVGSGLIVARSR